MLNNISLWLIFPLVYRENLYHGKDNDYEMSLLMLTKQVNYRSLFQHWSNLI